MESGSKKNLQKSVLRHHELDEVALVHLDHLPLFQVDVEDGDLQLIQILGGPLLIDGCQALKGHRIGDPCCLGMAAPRGRVAWPKKIHGPHLNVASFLGDQILANLLVHLIIIIINSSYDHLIHSSYNLTIWLCSS